MESDSEESLKKKPRKASFPGDFSRKNIIMHEEDIQLKTTRARFSDVLKRHSELAERLSRDSDKMLYERLQREFDAALASQTQGDLFPLASGDLLIGEFDFAEIFLDGEQWNDGLLATIRERVHMEADRKAMAADADVVPGAHSPDKITYKVGSKVICCLEGPRIGIQYETSYAGEPCELYHCVLESKSFLEKMTVLEHTIPFFLPLSEIENDLLSSNAMKFIDHLGELLQAYVDRREQVRLIKELYGHQIKELYHSLPYHMVDFLLDDFECKVTVSIKYAELVSVLPSQIKVFVWPLQSKKNIVNSISIDQKESEELGNHLFPARLSYAEDALRTMSLPEAYAAIVLNLPEALQQILKPKSSPA